MGCDMGYSGEMLAKNQRKSEIKQRIEDAQLQQEVLKALQKFWKLQKKQLQKELLKKMKNSR